MKAAAAEMKSSITTSSSDATDATRVCDRRLTGSVSASALGYFDVWYSGESSSTSSTHHMRSPTPTTSSSSAVPPHHTQEDTSPDDQRHQAALHRSSQLAPLHSIYVIDDHVTGNTSSACCGGGVVNGGFVGDGILTDSWRRVSWRARLRAGIARSTVASDPGPVTSGVVASRARRPSYLSDVIDSVTFFSDAGGNTAAAAATTCGRESPPTDESTTSVSVARCRSDGGEWTLRRDRDRDPDEPRP